MFEQILVIVWLATGALAAVAWFADKVLEDAEMAQWSREWDAKREAEKRRTERVSLEAEVLDTPVWEWIAEAEARAVTGFKGDVR